MSAAVRRSSNLLATRVDETPPSDFAVSVVTLFEIEYGLSRKPAVRARLAGWFGDFLSNVAILPLDRGAAEESGRIRAELARQPIGPYDVLLAGTARSRQLIMITANTSEFTRVPGLEIQNWELPFTSGAPQP